MKRWQKQVLNFLDRPSERSVYWIIGARGNEGKTFIQKYIQQLYGTRRVLKTEINGKKSDLAYLLSKETLTCKDIFLFNFLRSDREACYTLIENIKDGYFVSSKYKTKQIKIKTPNIVIVFSNSPPERKSLSADRWRIFSIIEGELCEIKSKRAEERKK